MPAAAQTATPAPGQPPANWYPSRYGADDQIGAMNLLNAQKVLEAVRLVTRGQVYRLGVPVGRETPAFPPRSLSVTVMMPDQFGGATVPSENRMSYADDMFTGWLGVGSQIDSFAHLGIDNVFYNGNRAQDFMHTTGVTRLGIEGIPPMVTRGVLVDMARARGKPMLDEGEIITADDLRNVMRDQGVQVRRGDVVLIHTGWVELLERDPARFGKGEPGIDNGAAEYLASLEVVAVGADTWGVEAVPFRNPNRVWEGHQTLLAKNGIHILEVMDTRALARDQATEFLFVLGQPLLKGAVQAIINPIAIR
ncbi:cyclase family protein [Siccirubricoccus sp. KC 17139]|uniref:Cyclase family protein n=1 Tax=Siccirubricoccus soli TaxID=2899147 RepID=A0ABT1D8A2_9PROT|nr:cyclase family protein [Siccirubricoccus soli]MCO6418143.1 cyclase family protein [Siccirubricoccus soli]MCP2684278.1 cyclase family protein [Siccirubricoccus soli]